jgi:predicted  nucleic acid-binding Zn-ribbon protein
MNRNTKAFKKFDKSAGNMESEIHKELLISMKKHRSKINKIKEKREKLITKEIDTLNKKREKLEEQLRKIDDRTYSLQLSLIHS